jgi:squalene-associated FAD-dependent desaturase
MKKIIIVGGGLAGLSAAVSLCRNYKITLLESTPKLGGRTYSFFDRNLQLVTDNGQHAMMGCYKFTLDYLEKINSLHNLSNQNDLAITFVDETGKMYKLDAGGSVYPINFINAILKFKLFSPGEKILLCKLFSKLIFLRPGDFLDKTIEEWLIEENQPEKVIKYFWEFLAISALNSSIKSASASIFISILQEVFLHGRKPASIILPENGLTELLVKPAEKMLAKNRAEIKLSETVEKFTIQKNRVIEIVTGKAVYKDFDAVISAVPYSALEKIIDTDTKNFKPVNSTIVSIHVKLKNNSLSEPFYAFVNSPIHWAFNNKTHLSLVISGADEYSVLPKDKIADLAADELNKYLNIKPEDISGISVIKEKRATYVPDAAFLANRPGTCTRFDNLFLAGDWIDTKLPCTIESAVKSGYSAAGFINRLI